MTATSPHPSRDNIALQITFTQSRRVLFGRSDLICDVIGWLDKRQKSVDVTTAPDKHRSTSMAWSATVMLPVTGDARDSQLKPTPQPKKFDVEFHVTAVVYTPHEM